MDPPHILDARREVAKKYARERERERERSRRFKGKKEANFFFESRGVTRVQKEIEYDAHERKRAREKAKKAGTEGGKKVK